MLAVIASNISKPAAESVDQDPGILTLAAVLVRAIRRSGGDAFARRCDNARATSIHAAR